MADNDVIIIGAGLSGLVTAATLTARGTRVTLRNSGWPEGVKRLDKVDATWKGILAALKQVVESGDVGTGVKLQYVMMRAFMWAMPSGTKSENVPEPPAIGPDVGRTG